MNGKLSRLSVIGLILCGMLISACARHDNFPPMIPVDPEPSKPKNFTVTPDGASVNFVLDWSVDNPAVVEFYRLYLVDPFSGFPVLIEGTGGPITEPPVQVNLGASLPGATFGVASVTEQSVESRIVFASAIDQ